MAAACGPEGHVLACEPHPLLAETYLPQNLGVNALEDRVEVCQRAIADRDGQEIEFCLHRDNLGASSLALAVAGHRRKGELGETIRVPTATLDRFCAQWPRLDLVKIDAEGAEALVWDGMQETLKRFPHAVVLVELHLQRDPPQVASFLHRLEREGYGLRHINYDGDIAPTNVATMVANLQEYWMVWIQR